LKAMSSGRPLRSVPQEIAQKTYIQMRTDDPESARLHLISVKRISGRLVAKSGSSWLRTGRSTVLNF
jgi:hypothetical protein